MIALLAPSKTMTFETESIRLKQGHQPELTEHVRLLVDYLSTFDNDDIKTLMKVNDAIARKTAENISLFSYGKNPERTRPAILAYTGATYKGLDVQTLTENDISYSETCLRILSGFYGIVSPLTLIEPYRLEMGLGIHPVGGKRLSAFWKSAVTESINRLLSEKEHKVIVNLASAEYMAAIDTKSVNGTIINAVFQEDRDGKLKSIAVYSKRARGMMARYIVKNRLSSPEQLTDFHCDGYRFKKDLSDGGTLVFVRKGN